MGSKFQEHGTVCAKIQSKTSKARWFEKQKTGKQKTPHGWLLFFATFRLLAFSVGHQEGRKEFEQGLTCTEVEKDCFGLMQRQGGWERDFMRGDLLEGYSDVGLFKET